LKALDYTGDVLDQFKQDGTLLPVPDVNDLYRSDGSILTQDERSELLQSDVFPIARAIWSSYQDGTLDNNRLKTNVDAALRAMGKNVDTPVYLSGWFGGYWPGSTYGYVHIDFDNSKHYVVTALQPARGWPTTPPSQAFQSVKGFIAPAPLVNL